MRIASFLRVYWPQTLSSLARDAYGFFLSGFSFGSTRRKITKKLTLSGFGKIAPDDVDTAVLPWVSLDTFDDFEPLLRLSSPMFFGESRRDSRSKLAAIFSSVFEGQVQEDVLWGGTRPQVDASSHWIWGLLLHNDAQPVLLKIANWRSVLFVAKN